MYTHDSWPRQQTVQKQPRSLHSNDIEICPSSRDSVGECTKRESSAHQDSWEEEFCLVVKVEDMHIFSPRKIVLITKSILSESNSLCLIAHFHW